MLKIFYLKTTDFADRPEEFFQSLVDEETFALAQGYRHKQVRQRKWLGDFMVRELLKKTWGLEKEDYRLEKGEHGKPYITNCKQSVFFNISHSGEYIVCAISDREVGIDIERKGRVRMEVARRFFHPEEIRRLEVLTTQEQAELFFHYWAVKESFLKYTGSGLTSPLSGFEVCTINNHIRIKKKDFEPIHIFECPIDPLYVCFICSEEEETPEIHHEYGESILKVLLG